MNEKTKKWLLIAKLAMYADIIIFVPAIFSVYGSMSPYVFIYGIAVVAIIYGIYMNIKGRAQNKKIICRFCGEEIIQMPKEPLHYLYELVKYRKKPDAYVWVHRHAGSIYCQTTKAEPENNEVIKNE